MNSPSVCVAVKVFISLSLLKRNSLDVGGHLEAAGRTTGPWGCAVQWPLWVAVGLDLEGALGWGPGDSRQARVVRKSVLRLETECTCIKYVYVVGCGKGRKRWAFLSLQKGF